MEFNVKQLFTLQQELDQSIYDLHHTDEQATFKRRILAFVVELAELANETRCFKFWSHKKPSSDDTILEEYADGLHFLLSIGLTLQVDAQIEFDKFVFEQDPILCDQFLTVFGLLTTLASDLSLETYRKVFVEYMRLGMLLGFDGKDIERGYLNKNKINHDRQSSKY